MGAPVGALANAEFEGFELGFSLNGTSVRRSLRASWDTRFEDVEPVREFSWRKGGLGFAGWYYSVTVRDHVGYESWLERDRLILLDRDPQVAAIISQPFWLHWDTADGKRRHAPDYLIRLADGRVRVVDVRAEDDMDDRTHEAFAATERACSSVGWEFEWAGRPDPVFMANVRWLARYRRTRSGRPPTTVARLLEVFSEPKAMWQGAELVGDRLEVLPVLFHLLWSGALETDLVGGLMESDSLVWARGARQWAG